VRSFVGVNCHLSKMDACSRYGQASPRFFITRGIYIYIYIYISKMDPESLLFEFAWLEIG
jgi:hypothetical protein